MNLFKSLSYLALVTMISIFLDTTALLAFSLTPNEIETQPKKIVLFPITGEKRLNEIISGIFAVYENDLIENKEKVEKKIGLKMNPEPEILEKNEPKSKPIYIYRFIVDKDLKLTLVYDTDNLKEYQLNLYSNEFCIKESQVKQHTRTKFEEQIYRDSQHKITGKRLAHVTNEQYLIFIYFGTNLCLNSIEVRKEF